VVSGRFASHYIDRGDDLAPKRDTRSGRAELEDGAAYCYQIQAFDSRGRIAAAEAPRACATTAPPPAAPSGLRAYSHQPREVALSWNPSPDPTVVGYRLFRSPSRQGNYLPIARLEGRFATTYVDRGLGALRVFYYRVASVNAADGVGKEAPEVRAVTKPEPLPPIGLRIEGQRLGSNQLAWDPNAEWDIDGYRLLRIREGGKARETVATTGSGATRAEDRAVGAGEPVSYRVVAFDRDGLESAPSDPIRVESVDYGLEALPQEDAIRLRWSPEVQRGFAAARVLREGFFGTREIARVPTAGFVDRDVKPGHRYHYLVVLVREDGSEAPPSAVIEAEAPK
jgi:fibronectin type 3 domain-containing protein